MTPERLAEFQALLGIADAAGAQDIWDIIEKVRRPMRRADEARRRVPNATEARRHLSEVASAARKFAKLLAKEPLAELLLNGGVFPGSLSEAGEIILPTGEERRAFAAAPIEFVKRIEGVAETAQLLAADDERFRLAHFLPNADQGAISTAALILWPILFSFWESVGKMPSYTPDGPFHRFVSFVHRELRLAAPSAGGLRHAIDRHIANRGQK